MKIRMKTTARGPEWGADEGQIVDRPDDEARYLIKKGFAEPVASLVETAVKPPQNVQTATKKP